MLVFAVAIGATSAAPENVEKGSIASLVAKDVAFSSALFLPSLFRVPTHSAADLRRRVAWQMPTASIEWVCQKSFLESLPSAQRV